jgi:hypothetical protein
MYCDTLYIESILNWNAVVGARAAEKNYIAGS